MIKLIDLLKEVKKETLTEMRYYVTYNKGRGQGKELEKDFDQKNFRTTDKPKVFNSYNDAKKYAEDMEKMFRNSIGGGIAYWVSDENMNPIKEAKKEKPGLWANIRAKRAKGEKPAKKGSKAFKKAVNAAKEINKNK